LNDRFKRKGFASLLKNIGGKNITNAPDVMVLGAKEFVQIISHFGVGGGTLITKSNCNPIAAFTVEFEETMYGTILMSEKL